MSTSHRKDYDRPEPDIAWQCSSVLLEKSKYRNKSSHLHMRPPDTGMHGLPILEGVFQGGRNHPLAIHLDRNAFTPHGYVERLCRRVDELFNQDMFAWLAQQLNHFRPGVGATA